jgi:hypothetical protein
MTFRMPSFLILAITLGCGSSAPRQASPPPAATAIPMPAPVTRPGSAE